MGVKSKFTFQWLSLTGIFNQSKVNQNKDIINIPEAVEY